MGGGFVLGVGGAFVLAAKTFFYLADINCGH